MKFTKKLQTILLCFCLMLISAILPVTSVQAVNRSLEDFSDTTNIPPIANFTRLCGGTICFFDASLPTANPSHDPDGTIVAYVWTFTDKSNGASRTLRPSSGTTMTFDFQYGGRYRVSLVVYDNEGASSTPVYRDVIIAGDANNPPTAVITLVGCSGTTCIFSGATSSDPQAISPSNGIAGYAWDCNEDGAYNDGATVTVACDFGTYGEHVVSLIVYDYAAIPFTDDTSYMLTVEFDISACDVNQDGMISPTDAIFVRNRIGQSPSTDGNDLADIDSDGDIDELDVQTVLAHLGQVP